MLRNKYFVELFSLFLALLLCSPGSTYGIEYHFSDTQEYIRIPEIYINFSDINLGFSEGQKIYIKVAPEPGSDNIRWRVLDDDLKMKIGLNSVKIGYKDYVDEVFYPVLTKEYRYLAGSARDKINGNIRVTGEGENIIKIPVKSEIRSNDRLNIGRLSLKISGAGEYTLKISRDKQNWVALDYNISIGNDDIRLTGARKFLTSDSSNSVLDFAVETGQPTIIGKNWPVRFVLDEKSSARWNPHVENYTVTKRYNESVPGTFQLINPKVLEWTPDAEVLEENTNLHFQNVQFRRGKDEASFPLKIYHQYSHYAEGLHWIQGHASKNKLVIANPQFTTNTRSPYTFYRDNSVYKLPKLSLKERRIDFFDDSFNMTITIPDSVPVSWDEELSRRNFKIAKNMERFSTLRLQEITDKKVVFAVKNIKETVNEIRLNGLIFKGGNRSIPPFLIACTLSIFENGREISLQQQLQIGQPSFGLAEDQLILSTVSEPRLGKLQYIEDSLVSTGAVGNELVYELPASASIKFDPAKFNQIELPSGFSISSEQSHETRVVFRQESKILPGSRLLFSNIPLKIPKHAQRVFGEATVRHKTGDKFQKQDNKFIEVANLNVSMRTNRTFIRNVDNEYQEFVLPEITLTNESAQATFEGSYFSLFLQEVDDYWFVTDGMRITRSQISPSHIQTETEGTKLILRNKQALEPNETIKINGLKIRFSVKHSTFTPKHVIVQMEEAYNKTSTPQYLTYSGPILKSRDDQVLYPNRSSNQFYTLEILTEGLDEIQSVILALPEESALQWSEESALELSGNAAHLFNARYTIFRRNKWLRIPVRGGERVTQGENQLIVNGLRYTNVRDLEQGVRIKISLDKGGIFSAEDEQIKRVVYPSHTAEIDRQRILEFWYPFKKGNKVQLTIPSSSPYIWNTNKSRIEYSRADSFTYRTENFDPLIRYSDDKKMAILTVTHDIDNPVDTSKSRVYQMFDFGQQVTLKNLEYKLPGTGQTGALPPEIELEIMTLEGWKTLKSTRSQWVFKQVHNEYNQCDIVLGLKQFPPSSPLNNSKLITWYRRPGNYLPYIWLSDTDNPEDLKKAKKEVRLRTMKNILLEHFYSMGREDIKYDWIFWYYLAWYKKRYQEVYSTDIESYNFSFPDELQGIPQADFRKAQLAGYDSTTKGAVFPPPGGAEQEKILRHRFVIAEQLFQDQQYLEAEDKLISAMRINDDMPLWLAAAYRIKLGQIAIALKDTIELQAVDFTMKTYPEMMFEKAQSNLSTASMSAQLDDWKPDLVEYMAQRRYITELREARNTDVKVEQPETVTGVSDVSGYNRLVQENGEKYYTIDWTKPMLAQTNQWQYALYGPNDNGRPRKQLWTFGQQVRFSGGNTYRIQFSPKKDNLFTLGSSVTLAGTVVLWLSL